MPKLETKAEETLAEIVNEVKDLKAPFKEDGEFTKLQAKVDALVKAFGGDPSKVDIAAILDRVDELDAKQTAFRNRIRKHRGPGYVSGMEDEAESFSVLRYMIGARVGFKKARAEREEELAKQFRENLHEKGLISADEVQGAYMIPDQVIPDVIEGIYRRSKWVALDGEGMTSISVVGGLFGKTVTLPRFDPGMIAYWLGEEEEYKDSKPGTGEITMQQKKLGALIEMTFEMVEMASYGLDALVRRDLIKSLATALDIAVPYGKGGKQPLGIIRTDGVRIFRAEDGAVFTSLEAARSALETWNGGEFNFDTLEEMSLAFEEDDVEIEDTDYKTVSSPRAFSHLKRLKVANFDAQTAQMPYLAGMPMLTNQQLRELIGNWDKTTTVKSNLTPGQSIGANAGNTDKLHTDVFAGDLTEVLLGQWGALFLDSDDGKGLGFRHDKILQKARINVDVQVREKRRVLVSPDARVRTAAA